MKTDVMVKKRILKTFKTISITLVVLLIMFKAGSVLAGQARLGDSPVAFTIASQTLADALADFQNDSGVNVIYKDRLVQDKTTPGLSGKYSPAAGLTKLLAGTGLTYQVTAENTVVLKKNKMIVAQREAEKRELAEEKKEIKRQVELEEMVVTAQKREKNVQDVPISMDVFTGMQLEDAGIEDMTELTYFSPNLYSKQNINQNMVIIRGISSHNVVLNTPAGLFVDDINYPLTFMQNPDLLDIERVEILRGPQGTLYGRNTESGAINIITKQPDNELRGKVFGEYGIFDTSHGSPGFYRAGGSISGPMVRDKLFLGIAFQMEDSDGYVENVLNGDEKAAKVDHKTGQGTIRWTPTEQWDISLRLNGFKNDDGYGYLRYVDGPGQSDRHTINWDGANEWTDENNGQVLQVKYEGDAFNVISITARNDVETNFRNDGEFGPLPLPDQVFKFANTILSQELRISSPKNKGPFEWLAGLYGFKDENDVTAEFFGLARDTDFENKGYAVFGQSTYTFFERLLPDCGSSLRSSGI